MQTDAATLPHEKYTVAWICALHIEMTAAQAMLDEIHDTLPTHVDDDNTYTLGRIHEHDVVISCLPTGCYGTINAATVISNLKRSFPSIRAGLMVGIGGGVPSKADLRLGDVVVGTRVMQYDMGKIVEKGQLQRTAIARIPRQLLCTAVSALRAKQERDGTSITSIVAHKLPGHSGYHRPDLSDDLFPPTYDHKRSDLDCNQCDRTKLVPRRQRNEPAIHYGAIASGNQVMRSALQRDIIGQELDVICFEMEAAGLMDIMSCLPIRGICDYSDSHKNKSWQRYAAATAAAFATELLAVLPTSKSRERPAFPSCPESAPPEDRCQQLLELLNFEQKDSRQSSIKTAHAKTCRWLLTHADYETWLNPERLMHHHGFLWIRGKPGAGKSTIMKFVYGNMRRARRRHGMAAAFFFNARGDYIERSVPGMYRSLLFQLLQGVPEVQWIVDNPDFEYQDLNECLELDHLKELFWGAVLALGQQPFTCFIDALDECDEQQVMDMVRFFEDLASKTTEKNVNFRICFSSRHYPAMLRIWPPNGNKSSVAALLGTITTNNDGVDITDGLGHIKDLVGFAGRTPLSWACQEGRIGIAKLLLENGASDLEADGHDEIGYSRALMNGQKEVLKLLEAYHGASSELDQNEVLNVMKKFCEMGSNRIIEYLIGHGADVNARMVDTYQSPIFWASNEATVRCLLKHGANAMVRDNVGTTPLGEMAKQGNFAAIKALIESVPEIDCNAVNDKGLTPLVYAMMSRHERVVYLLIENGADVRIGRLPTGNNVLHLAVQYKFPDLVKFFVRLGVKGDVPNDEGLTALEIARRQGGLSMKMFHTMRD
ncbi:Ankyrin-1 [Colletotrichum fructicola]|nr:Ankyrin-1 [Colletotrichum fructicola]